MSTIVDAGEHLRLINRVINQMGLTGDTAEEAFSEGLVAITIAAKTYQPEKGKLANWLAQNIRWSIYGWLQKEQSHRSYLVMDKGDRNHSGSMFSSNSPKDFYSYERDILDPSTEEERAPELNELLKMMKKVLTHNEYQAIIMEAAGYSGVEIGKKLCMNAVQVTRLKQKARSKLKEYR